MTENEIQKPTSVEMPIEKHVDPEVPKVAPVKEPEVAKPVEPVETVMQKTKQKVDRLGIVEGKLDKLIDACAQVVKSQLEMQKVITEELDKLKKQMRSGKF